MPLVSVVITAFNYDRYALDCVLSCLCQPIRDIEVVVVDDCSTDRTLEFLEMMASIDPRVTIISHSANKGYSAAKNTGIRAARGKYIRMLDLDDMLTLVGISKPLYFLQENHADFVHGIAYKLDGKNSTASYAQALRKQSKLSFDRRPKIHAQGVMYKKELHEKYGYYPETLRSRSDKFQWARFAHNGVKMNKIDSKLAFYRIHNKSMQAYRNAHPDYTKAQTVELKRLMKEEGIPWSF